MWIRQISIDFNIKPKTSCVFTTSKKSNSKC